MIFVQGSGCLVLQSTAKGTCKPLYGRMRHTLGCEGLANIIHNFYDMSDWNVELPRSLIHLRVQEQSQENEEVHKAIQLDSDWHVSMSCYLQNVLLNFEIKLSY